MDGPRRYRQTYIRDEKALAEALKRLAEAKKLDEPDDTENLPEMPEEGATVAIFFERKRST